MNIVVLENEPSSRRGGQERSLLDTCQGLADKGNKISLLYVTEGNLLKKYSTFCHEIIQVKGYALDKDIKLRSLSGFVTDLLNVPNHNDTVIYSNQYHDCLFGSALSLLKNKPYICHLRLPPPESFCGQWKIGLKGVRQFITISQKTKQDWMSCGLSAEKIDVVYNGIDTEVFKPCDQSLAFRKHWNIPEYSKVISYIGRLDQEKGIETLIKAFSQVLKHWDTAYLLIAGKPLCHENPSAGEDYVDSLKNLANVRGVFDRIKFLGHLDETAPLYQTSDITVLPSIHSEPFGRSVVESMACGTPAIASRTGGTPEILSGEFEKCLFSPGNDAELASVIEQVLSIADSDPSYATRCRRHVCEQFSTTHMVDGISEVLLKVSQNRQ